MDTMDKVEFSYFFIGVSNEGRYSADKREIYEISNTAGCCRATWNKR
jgi:hypothetical protein